MDPILEEMQRAKDVQMGRFRSWVQYLCALVATKDDEIERLRAQLVVASAELTAKRPRREEREVANG